MDDAIQGLRKHVDDRIDGLRKHVDERIQGTNDSLHDIKTLLGMNTQGPPQGTSPNQAMPVLSSACFWEKSGALMQLRHGKVSVSDRVICEFSIGLPSDCCPDHD